MFDKLIAIFRNEGCFWCHDWEVIEEATPDKLSRDHSLPRDYCEGRLYKRVCLRCGEVEDGITEYINEAKQQQERLHRRHEKALSLWQTHTADKPQEESIWQDYLVS